MPKAAVYRILSFTPAIWDLTGVAIMPEIMMGYFFLLVWVSVLLLSLLFLTVNLS
jgi:hypothetical protein